MRFHSSETIVEEVAWVDIRWIKGTQLRPEARQFGGGPLSGHWSWLDQGGQTSDQWTAGEGWNMKYDFCFRDEARLEGDGLMTAGTPGNIFFTGKHMKLQVSVLMGKGIQRMGQEGF
eukprot:s524_g9.t1